MFGKIAGIFWRYEKDNLRGRPVWRDRGFLGLLAGFIAALLAKYLHLDLGPDMQAAVITLVAGAFHLSQRHVGIEAKPKPDGGRRKTDGGERPSKPSVPQNFGY